MILQSLLSLSLLSLLACEDLENLWPEEDDEVSDRNNSSSSLLLTEDQVWSKMVRLAWEDYIARINTDKAVYGQTLDPLEMLDTSLNLSQAILGYQVEMSMWNISLHGLSQLVLKDLEVLRSPGLHDVQFRMELEISELEVRGLYQMEAVSWLLADLSSEGQQDLTINIYNATIIIQTEVVLATACGREGAVVRDIREIKSCKNISHHVFHEIEDEILVIRSKNCKSSHLGLIFPPTL